MTHCRRSDLVFFLIQNTKREQNVDLKNGEYFMSHSIAFDHSFTRISVWQCIINNWHFL